MLLQVRTRLTARLARTTASLAAAALLAVGLTAAPVSAAETAPAAQQQVETSAATFEDRILELLNDDREDKGLRPLERHDGLDDVAQAWSDRQADEGRMYHNLDFFDQYPGSPTLGGENVAYGYPTPEEMYQGWYDSPGHYANMFNPDYTHIGIGVAYDDGGAPYGTQNFAVY